MVQNKQIKRKYIILGQIFNVLSWARQTKYVYTQLYLFAPLPWQASLWVDITFPTHFGLNQLTCSAQWNVSILNEAAWMACPLAKALYYVNSISQSFAIPST